MIFIEQIIKSDNPVMNLSECRQQIKNVVPLVPSKKHLEVQKSGIDQNVADFANLKT